MFTLSDTDLTLVYNYKDLFNFEWFQILILHFTDLILVYKDLFNFEWFQILILHFI